VSLTQRAVACGPDRPSGQGCPLPSPTHQALLLSRSLAISWAVSCAGLAPYPSSLQADCDWDSDGRQSGPFFDNAGSHSRDFGGIAGLPSSVLAASADLVLLNEETYRLDLAQFASVFVLHAVRD
jgi:hypothetical protein